MHLTRRLIVRLGAITALCPVIGGAGLRLLTAPAVAQGGGEEGNWRHGLSLFGDSNIPPASSSSTTSIRMRQGRRGAAERHSAPSTISTRGRPASRASIAAASNCIYDTLMAPSLDEVSTEYGLLAEAVSHPADFSSVTYRLRAEATLARRQAGDGRGRDLFPAGVQEASSAATAAYYRHVVKAEKTGEREVTFTFDAPGNREMPQIVGQLNVLPKHWWEGTDASGKKRDIGATTLEPPLGNGAYRIKEFVAGPHHRLRAGEGLLGQAISTSISAATISTSCASNISATRRSRSKHSRPMQSTGAPRTAPRTGRRPTTFPAVKDKRVMLEEFPIRSLGVMQAFAFNIRRDKFKDRAGAARIQFRLRFRGDEQADLLRSVQAHRELFRGHRACVLGPAGRSGARDPGNVRDKVPPEVFTTPYTNPVGGNREEVRAQSARSDAAAEGGGLRGPRSEARRRQDRRAVHRRDS